MLPLATCVGHVSGKYNRPLQVHLNGVVPVPTDPCRAPGVVVQPGHLVTAEVSLIQPDGSVVAPPPPPREACPSGEREVQLVAGKRKLEREPPMLHECRSLAIFRVHGHREADFRPDPSEPVQLFDVRAWRMSENLTICLLYTSPSPRDS
eukprot:TRINITY_DN2063_c0_g1_i1.p1 TRINITY_DN2063_c0_g1~~TRINITY_DN2063_c0_g1_i1.p1  ORF type:complete len:150 (-),score=14.98 TRINITY_DN2063_c0_g1_i1:120-569(-)